MIHTYSLKEGTSIVLGNRTFWLKQDTQVSSFTDALTELDVCDAMQTMFTEDSSESIFDMKIQKLKNQTSLSAACPVSAETTLTDQV
jgi:hypothetical protein